ncbi:MAG: bifunctional (p)ppGpp synthetase/guanosine-3',5'-bis(diphosphate) 3'-pyrophosphohydrolase, partial [Bacteroidaceae bacterium]|nr:bifunctional (p)ppGpp synthetase/guanosine-3',5'-bis(diphosphate) 3'-pyrophosphohydrolase [Bacteroidaceae bacterium]
VVQKPIDTKKPITLNEETLNTQCSLATCCRPIPGDDVLGFIEDDGHIVIHKRRCPQAVKLKASLGQRILAANWETNRQLSFLAHLSIRGIDRIGLLSDVTNILSHDMDVNIHKLSIEVNDGIFEGEIFLYVHDVDDVKTIRQNLHKVEGLSSVTRLE